MENQTFDNMIQRISQPAIFFYPRSIFEEITGKDLKGLDSIGMTNTLIVRNSEGNLKPFGSVIEGMLIINRKELLDSNTFEILKMSSSLDKESFLYFLNKYFQNLDIWLRITLLTKDDAKLQASNYLPEIQNYLELQHNNTLDHKADLAERFGEWRINANKNRVLKRPLPSFDDINSKKESFVTSESLVEQNNKKTTITNKTTKKVTPSIEEVDLDLLQNIFNVNLTTNNNTTPNS